MLLLASIRPPVLLCPAGEGSPHQTQTCVAFKTHRMPENDSEVMRGHEALEFDGTGD
jgi:hypothetical protein